MSFDIFLITFSSQSDQRSQFCVHQNEIFDNDALVRRDTFRSLVHYIFVFGSAKQTRKSTFGPRRLNGNIPQESWPRVENRITLKLHQLRNFSSRFLLKSNKLYYLLLIFIFGYGRSIRFIFDFVNFVTAAESRRVYF